MAASTALLFVALALPGSAEHVQNDNGSRAVAFDHRAGNEWWVEVAISGPDASTAIGVFAHDGAGSNLYGLEKKSWGTWGGSFHIEPGHDVQFRVLWANGAEQNSCWFTHPAGVEQCSAPPALWPTTVVGDAGNPAAGGGDLGVGDADNDGRRDVTIGDWAGVFTFEADGTSWTRQRIGTTTQVGALAVGDGDGDGLSEVYAMSGGDLVQARFLNGAWSERVVLRLPHNPTGGASSGTTSGDMTLGNIDGVAGPELYIAIGHVNCDPEGQSGCSTTSYVYRVAFESGTWRGTEVSTFGGNIQSMWIGDGDSDGDAELYVGRSGSHSEGKVQVERVDGAWRTTVLPGWVGTGSQLVVGDVDRDGRTEVYTASFTGDIGLISYGPATNDWTHRVLVTLAGAEPQTLFIGDADNDGRQELYVGQGDRVTQVRYDSGQWKPAVISGGVSMLVVGDGDGDGHNEAYGGILSGSVPGDLAMRVVRIGEAARTSTGTFDATFTGVRGNEWWEQANVAVTGGTLAKVDVRLNDGVWQPLTKQSWGGYAASYRAVQGTTIQFRATAVDASTDLSECYRWIPASNTDATKVTCGTAVPPPPPPPPPGTFDATFSGVRGNEWWEQTSVAATGGTLAKVDVRLNDGAWQPLTKQSWGGYAASYRAVQGTTVQLRATAVDASTDLSECYRWIPASNTDATKVTCGTTSPPPPPPPPPPQPADFDATFTVVTGNEWWVQATVSGNQPIAKVQARDSPGPWTDLKSQSWGQNVWAASINVPYGEILQLRAQSTAGQWDYSANGWEWPLATPYPGPQLGTDYDAIFTAVSTDPTWVQVNVYADEGTYGLARVDYRIDSGAWSPLTRQTWGDWATSVTPGAGADVQFRAVAKSGHSAESGAYVWPGPVVAPAWPVAGSHVTYELFSRLVSGNHVTTSEATQHLTYDGAQWNAVCTGTTTEESDGTTTTTHWTYNTVQGPRRVSTNVPVDSTTNPRVIAMPASGESCEVTEWIVRVEAPQWRTSSMMREDDAYVLRAFIGREAPDGENGQDLEMSWEERSGMVLDWRRSGRMSQMTLYEGHLVDTDAHIT